MKKSFLALIAGLWMAMPPFCSLVMAAASNAVALVPQPLEVKSEKGKFEVKQDTAILVDNKSAQATNVGKQLAERLRASTGMKLKVSTADGVEKQPNAIRIASHGGDASLGAEGYRLEVAPNCIVITGGGGPGMFYGMQTLLQLMPPQVFSIAKVEEPVAWTVPAVQIKRLGRGFAGGDCLLDVSRHFFNKQEIENFLDLMAQHKLNTFHWHLVGRSGLAH